MQLKRLYERNAAGKMVVTGVHVQFAGPVQKFSPDLVLKGVAQGWMTMADDKIILKAANGEVTYKITRGPGYYCCHCGIEVEDSRAAVKHVVSNHAQEDGPISLTVTPSFLVVAPGTEGGRTVRLAKSPDSNNPSGYEKLNAYHCVMEEIGTEVTSG